MSEYDSKGKGRGFSYQHSSDRDKDSGPREPAPSQSERDTMWLTKSIETCGRKIDVMSTHRDVALREPGNRRAAVRQWEIEVWEAREALDRNQVEARKPKYQGHPKQVELAARVAVLAELLAWVPPITKADWEAQSANYKAEKQRKNAAAAQSSDVQNASLSSPVTAAQSELSAGPIADSIDRAMTGNSVEIDPLAGPTQAGPPLTTTPEKTTAPKPSASEPNSSRAAAADGPSSKAQGVDSWIWSELSPEEELATSDHVDEHALASSSSAAKGAKKPAPVDAGAVLDTLDSSSVIAERLEQQLAPWGLAARMAHVAGFVAGKREQLTTASIVEFDKWGPVLTHQRGVLAFVAGGVDSLLAELTAAGLAPGALAADHPAVRLLTEYAVTAGISELSKESAAKRAQLQTTHRLLPMAIATYNARSAHQDLAKATHDLEGMGGLGAVTAEQHGSVRESGFLQEKAAGMERMAHAGAEPSSDEMRAMQQRTQVVAYMAQVSGLKLSLWQLSVGLDAASSGVLVKLMYGLTVSVRRPDKVMQQRLGAAVFALQIVHNTLLDVMLVDEAKSKTAAVTSAPDAARLNAHAAAIEQARQKFAAVVTEHKLDGKLFADAQSEIHDAQVRALIANVVATIAIAMVTGGIGAAAGRLVGGAILAGRTVAGVDAAIGAVNTARVASAVTSVVVDAVAFSGAQTAMNGGKYGSNFVENLLTNTAVMGALKPFQVFAEGLIGADDAAKQLFTAQIGGGRAAVIKGSLMTAEIFTAMTVNYIGRQVAARANGHTPTDTDLLSFALEGAAMALGKLLHVHLEQQIARLSTLGERAGALVGRAIKQKAATADALSAMKLGDSAATLDVLVAQRALVADEVAFWRETMRDPAMLAASGYTPTQGASKLAAVESQLAATTGMATTRLAMQLNHLTEEIGGGRMWSGTHDDIAQALVHARKLGAVVEIVETAGSGNSVSADPVTSSSGGPETIAPVASTVRAGSRVMRVVINGETVQFRETSARLATTSDKRTSRTAEPQQSTGEVPEVIRGDDGYMPVIPAGASAAEIRSHVVAAKKLARKGGALERIADLVLGRESVPRGTNAARAQVELLKNAARLDSLESRVKRGGLPPDEMDYLQSQVDVTKAAMTHWQGVFAARDLRLDGTPIEAFDNPSPGFLPEPPEGHIYIKVGQNEPGVTVPAGERWNTRRKPGYDGASMEIVQERVGAPVRVAERTRATEPEAIFAAGTTKQQACDLLLNSSEDASLAPFMQMIERVGLGSRGELMSLMAEPSGATVRSIRHAIKQHYLPIVDRMLTFGNATGSGAKLTQDQSVVQLRSIIEGLNSTDMGTIGEMWSGHWGQQWHGVVGKSHPKMSPEMYPELTKVRFPDHQYESLLSDTKTGERLSSREQQQLTEMLRVTQEARKRELNGHQLKQMEIVFTNPKAAKNNRTWIERALERNPHLTVRMFDKSGKMHVFTDANIPAFEYFAGARI